MSDDAEGPGLLFSPAFYVAAALSALLWIGGIAWMVMT